MATTNPVTIVTPAQTITVSQDDLTAAVTFLQQYLSSALPEYDFSQGSALYDAAINAIAYVSAYYNYQITQIQQGLSVANVSSMPAGSNQDNAVNALMSNLFVEPTAGQNSTGFVVCTVSQLTDVYVPTTAVFNSGNSTSFVLNSPTNLLIPSTQLTPVVNPLGVIQQYTCQIPVISTGVGAAYNIQPTTFLSYTQFNPYITQIANTAAFQNGLDPESSSQLLAAAPTAITLRDLVSNRAITTVLETNFSTVQDVVVVSYGDAEMQRDIVPDSSTIGQVHAGGNVDVYINGIIAPSQTFTGTVGGFFTDPSPDITFFTDSTFFNADGTPNGSTFPAGAVPGAVLQVVFDGTPYFYIIQQAISESTGAGPTYLIISSLSPFPGILSGLPYSIGAIAGPPATTYTDIVNNLASNENGECTNVMFVSGAVGLPQTPIYQITSVSVLDPASSFANANGLVFYNQGGVAGDGRVSNNYSAGIYSPPNPLPQLSYCVTCNDPSWASSAEQNMLLYVANDNSQDGNQITITYDTIQDFDDVDEYTTDPFNRNPAASILAKGLFPVYLNFTLGYTLSSNPPANAGMFSEQACATALVNYVNTFPSSEILSVSNLINFVLTNFPMLSDAYPFVISGSTTLPFTVNYYLYSPTGDVLPYQTDDKVVVDAAHFQLPITTNSPPYFSNPALVGISARTVRPLLGVSDITFAPV